MQLNKSAKQTNKTNKLTYFAAQCTSSLPQGPQYGVKRFNAVGCTCLCQRRKGQRSNGSHFLLLILHARTKIETR